MPPSRFRGCLRALVAVVVSVATPVVGLAGIAGTRAAQAATTIDGPDVSSYQHPYGAKINWSKVKAAGKEFAIIKATEGSYYKNPYFSGDYWHAHEAGLVRGSYHFARPAYPLRTTAQAQADFYVAKLGDSLSKAGTLPPALDLEVTGGLSRGALITWAQTFLLRVRAKTGRTPMLYTYPYFWSGALGDPAAFARFPLWIASYDGAPLTPSTLWQFTAGARIDGIRGKVDMSRLTAPATTWSTLSDGRVLTDWQPGVPGRPNHVYATPAAGRATVHWLPGGAGSALITSYTVTASPGGATVRVSGLSTSATITGLHNGTSYTFTVTAGNAVGQGLPSNPTASVRPMIPTQLVPNVPSVKIYGHTVHVGAVLRRPDNGAVLAGEPVTMLVRPHGASTWTSSRTLTTGERGWVGRDLHPSTSIDVAFHYAGTPSTRGSRSYDVTHVQSFVGIHLSDNRIRRGHTTSVYGRIGPTAAGKAVYLKRYVYGAWRFVRAQKTTATGRYHFSVTPRHRSVRYYRVVVQAYGGRSRGFSRAVRLTVR